MVKKLNLGCGEFKKEGFINIDERNDVNAEIVHDLNVLPYPIKDGEFDYVEEDHVLKHLTDSFGVMREIHHISHNGAIIKIRVPHFSRGFTHSEHKRGFDVSFPLYFDPSFKGGYQGVVLEIQEMRLTWFAQKYLKRLTLSKFQYSVDNILDFLFSFLANLSPYFCSRVWRFWAGGFEEFLFTFVVKK